MTLRQWLTHGLAALAICAAPLAGANEGVAQASPLSSKGSVAAPAPKAPNPAQPANDAVISPISALEVLPATIEVPRFDRTAQTKAVLVARVTGDAPVPEALEPTLTASPGLEVTIGQRSRSPGDVSWPVSIKVTEDGPDDGAVEFRLAYPVKPKGDASAGSPASVIQIQSATLTVNVKPAYHASPVDDVQLSFKPETISVNELSDFDFYLVIKNTSDYALQVSSLNVDEPAFMDVQCDPKSRETCEKEAKTAEEKSVCEEKAGKSCSEFAATIAPHETIDKALRLGVAKRQRPQIGDFPMVASVLVKRGDVGVEREGRAVVSQTVKVGVAGVSDVLKILDIPSLLLIPGALILGVWSILRGWKDAKWPEWKDSSFWVISITLSIVIFGGTEILRKTGIGSSIPDFLVAYDTADVAWLWLGCVAGAALLYWLYRLELRRRALKAQALLRRNEPQLKDQPMDILAKMSNCDLDFYVQSYEDPEGNQTKIYDLGFPSSDKKAWMAPPIQVWRTKTAANAKSDNEIVNAINRASNSSRATRDDVLDRLKAASEEFELRWDQRGSLKGPQPLASDGLKKAGGHQCLIEPQVHK